MWAQTINAIVEDTKNVGPKCLIKYKEVAVTAKEVKRVTK